MGAIKTRVVPFSSVVGQSVLLLDGESGRTVAQLSILCCADAVGEQSYKRCSAAVAKHIVAAFEALAEKEGDGS